MSERSKAIEESTIREGPREGEFGIYRGDALVGTFKAPASQAARELLTSVMPGVKWIRRSGGAVNKVCSGCKEPLPATKEFFWSCTRRPDGLRDRCKACCQETPYMQRRRKPRAPAACSAALPEAKRL
jgi:hypothetical protein